MSWRVIIGFCALLLAVDWHLYFRHVQHFFQADSSFLIARRATSVSAYLQEFTKLHDSGWYRPLVNELIPSIFYPIFGLNPVPYHIAIYILFIGVTVSVYALAFALTRRHLTAVLATTFFSFHTVNSYSSYDVSDATELAYSLFYIVSVIAYLRYIQRRTWAPLVVSLTCFLASLCSKELAVTLPATLIVLHLLVSKDSDSLRSRMLQAFRMTFGHIVILVVYAIFVIGHLHVMGIDVAKLRGGTEDPASHYRLVLNEGILTNADFAASYAFNIPRGRWGQWQHPTSGMLTFLKLFRATVLGLIVVALTTTHRKEVLFGIAWFAITIFPALPLVDHFMAYYVFLPVVGLSFIVGIVFEKTYEVLRAVQPVFAASAISLVFAGLFYSTSGSIRSNIENNEMLGGSARIASKTLSDLQRMYPTLPAKSVIYFDDTKESLYWHHSWGDLLKMAYNTNDISILYASAGDDINLETTNQTIFLSYEGGNLVERTAEFRANPFKLFQGADSSVYKLSLSAREVTAGDKYDLSISGAKRSVVHIAYTLDDEAVHVFQTGLDDYGRATFDVSADTRKGVYTFLSFKFVGTLEWIRANATVTVR